MAERKQIKTALDNKDVYLKGGILLRPRFICPKCSCKRFKKSHNPSGDIICFRCDLRLTPAKVEKIKQEYPVFFTVMIGTRKTILAEGNKVRINRKEYIIPIEGVFMDLNDNAERDKAVLDIKVNDKIIKIEEHNYNYGISKSTIQIIA